MEKYEESVALKKAQLKKSELTPLQLAVKDAQTRFISAAKRFKFIKHLGVANHAETYNISGKVNLRYATGLSLSGRMVVYFVGFHDVVLVY